MADQNQKSKDDSNDEFPYEDDTGSRPFIAIAVLVCGVIGGLIMVISFIFFCKYCFKKRQPLATSNGTKRPEEMMPVSKRGSVFGRGSISASAGYLRRSYEGQNGASAVVHPIPVDYGAYLQQPPTANNNNVVPGAAVSSPLVSGAVTKKTDLIQKKLSKLAEEQVLLVRKEIEENEEYDEDATLAQVSDSNLVSTAGGINQDEFQDLFARVGSRRGEKSERVQAPSKKQVSSQSAIRDSASSAAAGGQQISSSGVSLGKTFDGRQRSISSVPQRQHRQKPIDRRTDALTVATGEDARRRSFDERLSQEKISQRQRGQAGADYYANQYDRKHSEISEELVDEYPADFHRQSRRHPHSSQSPDAQSGIDYPKSISRQQRSPISHLPRSHQMIVDKTSPPPIQQQSSTSSNGILIEPASKMYSRDHRNAVSYGAAEQDLSVSLSEKNMYARGHRLAFSFTDTGAERALPPPPPPFIRATATESSPDRRSTDVECASFNSAMEFESLEKFCRECRAVFQAATTNSSSSSDPHQRHRRNGARHLPRQRQVKSLDSNETGRRATVQSQRQGNSLDSTCVACMNDTLSRLALGDESMRSYGGAGAQSGAAAAPTTSPSSGAVLKRQLTMIESGASCDEEAGSDLMQLDDAQSEQVKQECKQLWQLRSVLEMEPEREQGGDQKEDRMIVVCDEYDDPMAQQSLDVDETGATTSYTTSFESNTEPITVEDYLRSRPSGPYLEPPRLSLEAKRQKLRSLYARRQMQLQQGASIESYESVDTVDSSSSGRPELILTSTESNQDQIGAQREIGAARPMISDQQQSSLSFDSSAGGDADQNGAPAQPRSFPVRRNDYLTPSTYGHRIDVPVRQSHVRHAPSRERRTVEAFFDVVACGTGVDGVNGTETDCSKSDVVSGESFDDSAAAVANQSMPTHPYPNIHLARMRRQYEGNGGAAGYRFPPPAAPPPPPLRDYCVDQRTEAIFKEFLRYDPRLEAPMARGHSRRHRVRRFQYFYNGSGPSYDNDSAASSGGKGGKLTQENSVEEDPRFGTAANVGHTQLPNRYDIPVIRLPEDDVSPSSQHRAQLGTAMAAKG